MAKTRQACARAFALILAIALSGCATYADCGLRGCPGDARITADVRASFDQHPALEPPNLLYVNTLNHVVYLSGRVNTDLERHMAESLALGVTGVARVVNSIALSYPG